MYISVKPVHFTDEELETIFEEINFAYIELCKRFYPEADPDNIAEALMERYDSILDKIKNGGVFDNKF